MQFNQFELLTPRLKLRKIDLKDTADIFTIYGDPQALEYWGHEPYTDPQQAADMITDRIKWWDSGDSICFVIEERASGRAIGTISLFSIHESSRRAEIGYILNRDYWRQGLANEGVSAAIDYAFNQLNLNRLEADIDPENSASAALLSKLGFTLEGKLRQRWIVDGRTS